MDLPVPSTPTLAQCALLRLAGGLFLGGFVANFVATQFHPHGDENDHPVVFDKYADSEGWVAIHFWQFAGVLLVLGGFVVLYRLLQVRGEVPLLAKFGLASTVATAAVWAVLQGLDGVALKQAVDAWASASGPEKAFRFADAETLRLTEWGFQSCFRLLLGLTFVLFGTAIALTGVVARWLGWLAVLGGLLYAAVGVAVGHTGFEKPGDPFILGLFVVFVVGVLVTGLRMDESRRVAEP